jgi:uncharacterized repeat protein (TIGR03803 family)
MSCWKKVALGCALFAGMTAAASAQTFTTLAQFGLQYIGFSSFIQGRDGNLYGTAVAYSGGSVLKITPTGTITVLHNFCAQGCRDGSIPGGSLVLGTDGNFYGLAGGGITTNPCAYYGCGIVYRITPAGVYTVLHYFNGSDGNVPSGLVEGSDKNFYGTTTFGGSGSCDIGCGTIFKMTAAGVVTPLHSFNESDGFLPTGLVQGADGDLYGTTRWGGQYALNVACEEFGAYGCGTVFKITTSGAFTLLHSFDVRADGAEPYVPVAQANDGTFYGTTFVGRGWYSNGTVFSITSTGVFTTVYNFVGTATYQTVGLFPASDGNLYGTTTCDGEGLIYSISQSGAFTSVYAAGCEFGSYAGGVFQATNGVFYGVYSLEGQNGVGELYSLDVGLDPFVTFVLPVGRPGQTAQILGQGLTGTTSVTFNGVAATKFSVVSDTYMTAVVPAGTSTGPVVITTPTGTLTSNVSFRISK